MAGGKRTLPGKNAPGPKVKGAAPSLARCCGRLVTDQALRPRLSYTCTWTWWSLAPSSSGPSAAHCRGWRWRISQYSISPSRTAWNLQDDTQVNTPTLPRESLCSGDTVSASPTPPRSASRAEWMRVLEDGMPNNSTRGASISQPLPLTFSSESRARLGTDPNSNASTSRASMDSQHLCSPPPPPPPPLCGESLLPDSYDYREGMEAVRAYFAAARRTSNAPGG
ncbi:hypothetical protein KC19_VG085800 [Ceratodon purpureus]|uniref:Uncharacterized protein n=1 Tax=Ceratodon purpureus TaxID=3225 RepID=A0A8T0HNB6_CERPU|nr:hypothetical protein KC19_VG085800 [Ceratodon purpureus]